MEEGEEGMEVDNIAASSLTIRAGASVENKTRKYSYMCIYTCIYTYNYTDAASDI